MRTKFIATMLIVSAIALMGSVAFFLLTGCSTISLKAPTTQILIQDVAQTTGYLIGKNNPELAKEFIAYTQTDISYSAWKQHLTGQLVEDEFLRMKMERLFSLVDIDLQLKTPTEQEQIIKELFREFISGLGAGINT